MMILEAAKTFLVWYLSIGGVVVAAGAVNDLVRHKAVYHPVEAAIVALLWPAIFVIVYRMWKKGELV